MSNQGNKRYYWLKLKRDFFKRHDIRIIESQPNGKDYVLFYLKMLVESIDHEGELRFSDAIPYDENMLSVITNTNVDIVRAAMTMFINLHMIELFDDKTIFMSEVERLTGSETAGAERVRKHRAMVDDTKPKALPAPKSNAERQIGFRAKKLCEEKQHVPFIEDYMNNERYGGNYYIVMKRDGFKCAICGSIEKLCVHHIDGCDEQKPENNADNKMVTLCRTCHSQTHAGAKIPDDLLDSIDYSNVTDSCNADVTKCNTEKEKEKEKETEIEGIRGKPALKRFTPPTIDEVKAYCAERKNTVDAEHWFSYYEANGWMVGRNKMKDWKASVRTWERNNYGKAGNVAGGTRGNDKQASNFDHLSELI